MASLCIFFLNLSIWTGQKSLLKESLGFLVPFCSQDKDSTSSTGGVYFLVLHGVDTVHASQVFRNRSLQTWTLSLPVIVVVCVWVSVGPMVHVGLNAYMSVLDGL